MRSGLDDQGRQAGQVGEYRADKAESGVLPGGVVGDPDLERVRAEQRVGLALGLHGRPGQGEVGIRRHDEGRGGLGQPVISGVDQGGDGEPAAGGLSREDDVRRGGAVVQEGLIGGQSIIDRGRIRVLGTEPVVDGHDPGRRPPADLRGQVSGEEGVPHHVHAAVEVQDDVTRLDSVDGDLGDRDTAQLGLGHGDVGGQRLRRQQLPELTPLLVGHRCSGGRLTVAGLHRGFLAARCSRRIPFGWLGWPGRAPRRPDGRPVTARLSARQVSGRHLIPVIRASTSISIFIRGSARPQTSIVAAGRTSPKQRRRSGQQGSKSSRSGSR